MAAAAVAKADEGFSPTQLGALTGAPVRQINKVVDERLPRSLVWSAKGARRRRLISPAGAVCFAIDAHLPREVPLDVRKAFYAKIARARARRLGELGKLGLLRVERGPMLSYAVDVRRAVDEVSRALERYRRAMRLIVEDPAVQGGAATFRGTRILVHHVAGLLAQGAPEAELLEDMPRLTPGMIAAARVFARAHPRRGRPRLPAWREKGRGGQRPAGGDAGRS